MLKKATKETLPRLENPERSRRGISCPSDKTKTYILVEDSFYIKVKIHAVSMN